MNAAVARTISIKNSLEILYGYESALEVGQEDPLIQITFKKTVDRLPAKGELTEMTTPMHLATVELAGSFCSLAAKHSRVFSEISLSKPPFLFPTRDRVSLIQSLAYRFWQRLPTREETLVFLETLEGIEAGHETEVPYTEILLRALCVDFGTSLSFLIKV